MTVAPQTDLDLESILCDKLELKPNEVERYFDFEQEDGKLIVKVHRDGRGKPVWVDRTTWNVVNNYVKELSGAWVPRERLWEIPVGKPSIPKSTPISTPKSIPKPQKLIEPNKFEVTFVLSPFNINFDFKDQEHIDLLKKQIMAGHQLEIICYEEDGKLTVIDGGHTLEAYKQLKVDPQQAKITIKKFDNDADKIAFSRHRNTARLQQEPTRYAKSVVSELKFRLGVKDENEVRTLLYRYKNLTYEPKRYKSTKEDKKNVFLIDSFFEKETKQVTTFLIEYFPLIDFPSWLGNMVDGGKLDKSKAMLIEKTDFPEGIKKKVAEECTTKSVTEVKEYLKSLEFEPKVFTVWNFSTCDPRFGVPDFPGRIPGQIVQNVLYRYTEEDDLVVDPMAGSGTTYDVCEIMNRRCLCYDIEPIREELKKHDITTGFPKEAKKGHLIFLDPPYFKKLQNKERYNKRKTVEGKLSSKEDFLSFMAKLAKDCFGTLNEGGIVALLVSDFIEDDESLLTSEYYILFKQVGFKPVNRFQVPLTTQQYPAHAVKRAQERRELLNITRDLYIFRK